MPDEPLGPDPQPNAFIAKALFNSEEMFRRLVESVRDYAIFALDSTGHVVSWNTGAERINGYTASEIIGAHFSRFYTAEDIARGHPQNELRIARRDGRYEEEGWRVRKDGSQFLASVVIAPLIDADGQFQGFSKVTRDITEKKRAETERLQQANERANREFLRQILWIVTEGRLRMCHALSELPPILEQQSEWLPLSAKTLWSLRQRTRSIADAQNMPTDRTIDLITAVGEASMNAVQHGGGGTARICTHPRTLNESGASTLQVWIEDHGPGIALDNLHWATLKPGFTTAGSLGYGFWLMLQTCDRLWLWTNPTGTTIVLEQDSIPPPSPWLPSLDAIEARPRA